VCAQLAVSLEERLRPQAVRLDLEAVENLIAAAEDELRIEAIEDRDRCCGYFPALEDLEGIRNALPACRALAKTLPTITHQSVRYRFNFLRLSLIRQSVDPAFHLDSDAATALTGDMETLHEREVLRLLLNLSCREPRVLHYLDVDPRSIHLVVNGSYVRVKDPGQLKTRACRAVIPPRIPATVHGLVLVSNRVLHSGLDGEHGHFIAAYGVEAAVRTAAG
jgi:hypothetical protein